MVLVRLLPPPVIVVRTPTTAGTVAAKRIAASITTARICRRPIGAGVYEGVETVSFPTRNDQWETKYLPPAKKNRAIRRVGGGQHFASADFITVIS